MMRPKLRLVFTTSLFAALIIAIACSSEPVPSEQAETLSSTPTPTPEPAPNLALDYVNEIALLSGKHARGGKAGDKEFTPMAGLTGEDDFLISQAISRSEYTEAIDLVAAVTRRINSSGSAIRNLSAPSECQGFHSAWLDGQSVFISELEFRQQSLGLLAVGDLAGYSSVTRAMSGILKRKSEVIEEIHDNWTDCMAAAYSASYGEVAATPQVYPTTGSEPAPPGKSDAEIEATGSYVPNLAVMFRLIGEATIPGIDEGIDWYSEQRRLIEARGAISAARETTLKLDPPDECADFHDDWFLVLDHLELQIQHGISLSGLMANNDVQGAYELSSEFDYQFDLYTRMNNNWLDCTASEAI